MKYRTLVIDPPWAYRDTGGAHGIGNHYTGMSLDALAALPLAEWGEANMHAYIWATNGFMEQAHQVARAWGFEQKTIITWIKHRKDQAWLGMGRYYRNTTEHVLFCVRGSLKCDRFDVPTHFFAERGRHSEKPAAFYDMVESMSPGPYLDVFARKLRFNWDAWGDEVGAPDGLPTPQEVAAATQEGEEGA